ncbi:MAG: 30S ribosomal protein S12 methylthiotransferase RimO [Deltaproteobacteria bacterium]|nr:30S ribosomal protein S12 methylthiotransferase RimO [Deltaproteobacteria bacterium]
MEGRRLHLVSLGCPKNRVDSECLLGRLLEEGWTVTADPGEADVIVVHTCAFIRPAVEESLETILELARWRAHGPCRRLVVAGCLPQRYGADLARELPEVDLFVGVAEVARIPTLLDAEDPGRVHVGRPADAFPGATPRAGRWAAHAAYLKIAEGCHRRCSYCIIPRLRGPLHSRPLAALLNEARSLADDGVRELTLVAQDTTAWGRDLPEGAHLADLLGTLARVDGLTWIRLLYANPLGVDDRLLEALAAGLPVLPYVDVPVQHASPRVLGAMGRGIDPARQEQVLDRLKACVPGITVRSTVMVGFPGETDEDVEALLAFVQRRRFDHLGVFRFFPEEGTPAERLPGRVPVRVARQREDAVVAAQARIARDTHRARIGCTVEVLVDGPSREHPFLWEGRLPGQAPEVDGRVVLTDAPPDLRAGQFRQVRVMRANGVDLVASLAGGPE